LNKTYQYFIQNHTTENIVEKLLFRIAQTELTFDSIDKKLFKKSWAIRIIERLRPLYKGMVKNN
jgi:hypothetical protein